MASTQYSTPHGNIYVYDRAIPPSICEKWMKFPQSNTSQSVQTILKRKEDANEIFEVVRSCLEYPDGITRCFDDVTYSRNTKPVCEHVDKCIHGERYKLLIYLNHVENGGTLFKCAEDDWITVNNQQGSVVIFGIRIPHKGDARMTEGHTKITMGIRLD